MGFESESQGHLKNIMNFKAEIKKEKSWAFGDEEVKNEIVLVDTEITVMYGKATK